MQLKQLQYYLQRYKRFLTKPSAEAKAHIWEAQRIFQENWDLEAEDLAEMYDRSLQNQVTKRLWKRENYEPKRLMLAFIKQESDFVRQIFGDLFKEDKSVDGRVGRFVFHCDELLQAYKEANPRSIENNHYHDDYHMVFLYLSFRYPAAYTLYDFEAFRKLLDRLGVASLPNTHDPERFFKVCRTLYRFLEKDAELMERHYRRLNYVNAYREDSMLIVYDFYQFVARSAR